MAYCEREGIPYQVIEPKDAGPPAGRLCRQFCVPARRALDPLGGLKLPAIPAFQVPTKFRVA